MKHVEHSASSTSRFSQHLLHPRLRFGAGKSGVGADLLAFWGFIVVSGGSVETEIFPIPNSITGITTFSLTHIQSTACCCSTSTYEY